MIATLLALAVAATPPSCGAVERPGIAERGSDGIWRGIAVELCRKAALAFHPYRSTDDLRDASRDALAVLTLAERAIALPAANAPTGPPVAIDRQLLLVHPGTPPSERTQLAGHRVCFIIATAAEAALNTWARPAHIAIQRVGFQEPVELRDAFDAGYCAAMAVDARDIPGGAGNTQTLGPSLAEVQLFPFGPKI